MPIPQPLRMWFLVLGTLPALHASDARSATTLSEPLKAIEASIHAVRSGDVARIAKHIRFPLRRAYPLPPVDNPEALATRYTEIFDANLLALLSNSVATKDWAECGWRGYMLDHGTVWADFDGRIIAINSESAAERAHRLTIIEADRRTLHPALQTFKQPCLKWDTKTVRIRIDDLGSSYRLALWNVGDDLGKQPALSISGGEIEYQGSGGNHEYRFKAGETIYHCDVVVLGGEESPKIGTFSIQRNARELFTEEALRAY